MEDQQLDVAAGVVIKPLSLENETNFSALQEHGPAEAVVPPKTNFSAFPDDFVTQFSPVEEEPVPRNLSSAEEFVDINDKTYSSSPSTTTEHHTVHFDAAEVEHSGMRMEGAGGGARAHDEEEFTYHRSGPLLVGEPVAAPRVTVNGPKTTPAVEEEEEVREEEPQARIVQPPNASFVCSLKKDAEVEESGQNFFTWLVNEPRLKDLVYWRNWQKSLAVFGPGFVSLLCLTLFPFLSVLAYSGLLVIAVNITLRLYVVVSGYLGKNKTVDAAETSTKCQCRYEKAVQSYLSGADLQLNDAKVKEQVETNVARWNTWFPWLQRLVLAEDVFATLKLALALWLLTYVGAWLSPAAMTLISFVATFTLPKFYHTYKKPIDKRLADVSEKAQRVSSAVKDKYSSLTTQKQQLKKTE